VDQLHDRLECRSKRDGGQAKGAGTPGTTPVLASQPRQRSLPNEQSAVAPCPARQEFSSVCTSLDARTGHSKGSFAASCEEYSARGKA
jgi:hypothetical protein